VGKFPTRLTGFARQTGHALGGDNDIAVLVETGRSQTEGDAEALALRSAELSSRVGYSSPDSALGKIPSVPPPRKTAQQGDEGNERRPGGE